MLNKKALGAFIRKQRNAAGYSLNELSKYANVSFKTISQVELGERGRFETIDLILNQLGYKLAVVRCTETELKKIKEARKIVKG